MELFKDDTILITKNFNVGQDWYIPITGFFVVGAIDKSKKSILDFTEKELVELMQVARKIRGAMKKVLGINEVYLFQNEDSDHGFHLWLFPRHEWMEQFGRKIESVRPIMKYTEEHFNNQADINKANEAALQVKNYLLTTK